MKNYILFEVFLFVQLVDLQLAAQNYPNALNSFLRSESLKHASVSFEMIDLSSGKSLAAYNEHQALIPASALKIVTTATALEVLGRHFSYATPLFYDGIIERSVLKGNLYIEGSGDPTLGSEFIKKEKEDFLLTWLNGIQKAGIRQIDGQVIVLDQLFGYEGMSPKWLCEDLGNYYAPGIYGISIFDNMYRVYLQSFYPGSLTKILYTEPAMRDLRFTNAILASSSDADDSYVSGTPFSNERHLHGAIPANRAAFAARGDIPDPGLFLAQYVTDYLRRHGIEATGIPNAYRLSLKNFESKQELALVRSPDLMSIIQVVNIRSNNHYAEHLYKRLTICDSVDIPAYWEQKGLDASALFMYDGSGLSPANAVSAGFLVQILNYMDGKGNDFYNSLPVAGKEGTVASFLKGTVLEGKARIKSGSMTNVQSYAGYIENGGKRYAFALIVNHFTGQRKDLRKAMEKLLIGVASAKSFTE